MKEVVVVPTCKKCATRWTWFETVRRASFAFGGRMTCPYCGKEQYVSAQSRKWSSFSVLFVMIPFFINIVFDLSLATAFVLAVLTVFIIIAVYPFFVTLANEEEPLF